MIWGVLLFVAGCWIATQNTSSKLSPVLIAAGLVLIIMPARGAEQHGHTHDGAVGQFYKSWMMPSNRAVSCCHDEDCAPAESKFENGNWLARRAGEDGEFTPIPSERVEHDRDTPDGRSHLCGRRYGFSEGNFTVFCFLPGSGG